MSEFTHARICIRHGSGSVEIQAPAGEVTWLDLSGLHAVAIANGKRPRWGRRFLATFLFFGCSAAVGVGVGVASSGRSFSAGSRAEVSVLDRPTPQQAFLPDLAVSNAVQAPRVLPPAASGPLPQPAAPDADPFGLKR